MTATNQAFEVITTPNQQVACDGASKNGSKALGHPRVFLQLSEETHEVTCPYCSRVYRLAA
jgi:uncharacterized Zn-finger protein